MWPQTATKNITCNTEDEMMCDTGYDTMCDTNCDTGYAQLTDYTWELQLWRWPPRAFPDDRAAGVSQYWTRNWSVMDEST